MIKPLLSIMTAELAEYLGEWPENGLCPVEGYTEQGHVVSFFAKAEGYDRVRNIVEADEVEARISLQRREQPEPAYIVSVDISAADSSENVSWEAAFDCDNDLMLESLLRLIDQRQWSFVFLDNACEYYYGSKVFSNPVGPEEREHLQQAIKRDLETLA